MLDSDEVRINKAPAPCQWLGTHASYCPAPSWAKPVLSPAANMFQQQASPCPPIVVSLSDNKALPSSAQTSSTTSIITNGTAAAAAAANGKYTQMGSFVWDAFWIRAVSEEG